jgi:hypothetical protein
MKVRQDAHLRFWGEDVDRSIVPDEAREQAVQIICCAIFRTIRLLRD